MAIVMAVKGNLQVAPLGCDDVPRVLWRHRVGNRGVQSALTSTTGSGAT